MRKKEFELTIFQSTRALFGLFLSPFIILSLTFLGAEINSFIIPLLLIVLFFFIYYHFVVGYLTIIVSEEKMEFNWTEKMFFNFKEIHSVNITEIKTIVIDNGEFIRKIKTSNRSIQIGTAKIQQKDAVKFIRELKNISKRNDAKIIDSWDEWFAKGYLKIAYRINTIILIIGGIVITTVIAKNGFNAKMIFLVLFLIPQMLLYGKQMKQKLKK